MCVLSCTAIGPHGVSGSEPRGCLAESAMLRRDAPMSPLTTQPSGINTHVWECWRVSYVAWWFSVDSRQGRKRPSRRRYSSMCTGSLLVTRDNLSSGITLTGTQSLDFRRRVMRGHRESLYPACPLCILHCAILYDMLISHLCRFSRNAHTYAHSHTQARTHVLISLSCSHAPMQISRLCTLLCWFAVSRERSESTHVRQHRADPNRPVALDTLHTVGIVVSQQLAVVSVQVEVSSQLVDER